MKAAAEQRDEQPVAARGVEAEDAAARDTAGREYSQTPMAAMEPKIR